MSAPTNPAGLTPAELAVLDQTTAGLGDVLDAMVRAMQLRVARRGPAQAAADLCVDLNAEYEPHALAALAAVAIGRLAERGGS